MSSRIRTTLLLVALHLMCASPAALHAQTLRGRILDDATGTPIGGGFARLVDANGVRVAEWLSDSAGRYSLAPRAPGRYIVRIERLGYRVFESDTLTVDGSMTRDFRLPASPIELPAITATGRTKCDKQAPTDGETATIWEEVRKALTMTSWTSQNVGVHFRVLDRIRRLDKRMVSDGRPEEKVFEGLIKGSPFAALAVDSLLAKSFIQKMPSGHYEYFGPDAELIMSDGFQETHCFRAVIDRKQPSMIGLSFEPAGAIEPYDISGTLWLDKRTLLLTRLDFDYAKLPVNAPRTSAGGEIHFTKFQTGMWIISSWTIRVPIMREQFTNMGKTRVFTGVHERSQYVLNATMNGRDLYTATAPDR